MEQRKMYPVLVWTSMFEFLRSRGLIYEGGSVSDEGEVWMAVDLNGRASIGDNFGKETVDYINQNPLILNGKPFKAKKLFLNGKRLY